MRHALQGLVAAAALLAITTPAMAGVVYTYDAAGRLATATYSNGVRVEYRYDTAGNRTQIVTTEVPNTAPVAVADTAGVAASGSVNIQVLNNDDDANADTLNVTAVSSVTGGGSVSIQGGGDYVRFTASSSTGSKTFTYTANDGRGGTDTATVTVIVTSANAAPVAVADSASVAASSSTAIMVRANDTDANGDTLTVTGVTTPTGGTAVISGSGGSTYVTYTAPSTAGTRTFNYTISDGNGGTSSAQVTVTVSVLEDPGEDPGDNCGGPGQPTCP